MKEKVMKVEKATASQIASLCGMIDPVTGRDNVDLASRCEAVAQISTSLEASLGMVSADYKLTLAYHGIKDQSSKRQEGCSEDQVTA